jgi:putative membrane protein
MSDEQTPKNTTRKPRFFRPDDVGIPKPETSVAAEISTAEREELKTAAKQNPQQAAAAATQSQTASTAPSVGLHQPKNKRRENENGQSGDEFANTDSPDELSDDQGTTIPTLKDIKRGFRWTAILMSAVGALAAMAFTAWLHSHVEGLLAREDWIGWLALGLVALVVLALLMIALKELLALRRLKKLGNLREIAERAIKHDEREPAEKIQAQVTDLFYGRHSLSWGIANLKEHQNEVLSARDRLMLVERSLMVPLDGDARKIVASSAKRVSVMTAISPFIFLDMLLVAVENFKMLRRLMTLYGGRPGLLSQFKMIQMMIANLALSGGVAVGADLLGHVMGRQVATKLAGRIGEGMINGSLTARLGITATKLIRPLPYIEAKPTTITAFVKELTRGSKGSKKPD